jgi:cytochrome c oxidase subunit 2
VSPHPSPAQRGRRRTAVRRASALSLVGLLAAGCDVREAYEASLSFGVPEPVSEQGENIYELYLGSNAAALVVGTFVLALILFAVFRYRKRTDDLPRQVRYNLPIEVLYTVIPFVIVAVLFYYTVLSQNEVNDLTEDEAGGPDVTIGVIGFQWNWQFQYLDEGVQVTGLTDRPAELVLPVGRTIRFLEESPDVIHSFFVPEFLFKRDVIPGRQNTFELTLTKEGQFTGRCAELCGEKHAFMNFSVLAVSPDEYERYIAELQDDPEAEIVEPVTAADNLEESDEE